MELNYLKSNLVKGFLSKAYSIKNGGYFGFQAPTGFTYICRYK